VTDADDRPFVMPRTEQDLTADHYPQLPAAQPPAGLSRKERRAWRHDARRGRSAALTRWRDRPENSTDGLGVLLLVAAVCIAGFVFFGPGRDDAGEAEGPRVQSSTGTTSSTGATSSTGPATTRSTAAPRSTTAPAAGPTSVTAAATAAALAPADPARPVPFDVAGGSTAADFLATYLTFDPTAADPVGEWVGSWSSLSSSEVASTGRDNAARLWDFTIQQQVRVTPGPITGTATAGSQQVVWHLEATRTLTPIDGSPSSTDTVTLLVTVIGAEVTNVQNGLTGISE